MNNERELKEYPVYNYIVLHIKNKEKRQQVIEYLIAGLEKPVKKTNGT